MVTLLTRPYFCGSLVTGLTGFHCISVILPSEWTILLKSNWTRIENSHKNQLSKYRNLFIFWWNSDESLGRDETSCVRLATKISQVTVNVIVHFHSWICASGNRLCDVRRDWCHHFFLANGTLGAMPNEFAKEKGLWWVSWLGWNENITSNCQLYCYLFSTM